MNGYTARYLVTVLGATVLAYVVAIVLSAVLRVGVDSELALGGHIALASLVGVVWYEVKQL